MESNPYESPRTATNTPRGTLAYTRKYRWLIYFWGLTGICTGSTLLYLPVRFAFPLVCFGAICLSTCLGGAFRQMRLGALVGVAILVVTAFVSAGNVDNIIAALKAILFP